MKNIGNKCWYFLTMDMRTVFKEKVGESLFTEMRIHTLGKFWNDNFEDIMLNLRKDASEKHR